MLEVYTSYEENTSCHCHPEYQTREHETRHYIPYAELTAGFEDWLSDDDWENGYFEPSDMPVIVALRQKIDEAKQAAKQKAEADRLVQVEAQKRAAEKRERDELARLQSKYPTA